MPALTANARTKRPIPAAAREVREGIVKLQHELIGRAMNLTRSRVVAEDLVQDTVERAIRFQRHYKSGSNLRAWVHQILFTVFITRCRRNRLERIALADLSTSPCSWCAPQQGPEMIRLSPPVQRALDGLPARYRRMLVLIDLQDMSYKAVAKRLRLPMGTVMSRLHRSRRALAEAVGGVEERRAAA